MSVEQNHFKVCQLQKFRGRVPVFQGRVTPTSRNWPHTLTSCLTLAECKYAIWAKFQNNLMNTSPTCFCFQLVLLHIFLLCQELGLGWALGKWRQHLCWLFCFSSFFCPGSGIIPKWQVRGWMQVENERRNQLCATFVKLFPTVFFFFSFWLFSTVCYICMTFLTVQCIVCIFSFVTHL